MTTVAEQKRLYNKHATEKKERRVAAATVGGAALGVGMGMGGSVAVSRGVNAGRGAAWALRNGPRAKGVKPAFERAKQGAKYGARIPNSRTEALTTGPVPIIAGGYGGAYGGMLAADRRQYPEYKRTNQGFAPRKKAKEVHKAFAGGGSVQRGLSLIAQAPKPTKVAPQKFSAPTPRLTPLKPKQPKAPTIHKAFTPMLSSTRAMRLGQVGTTSVARARQSFGGAASRQFAAPNIAQGKRAAGAARFGAASGGAAVPRGAGAAASAMAGKLRPAAPQGMGRAAFTQTQGGGAVPRGAGASAHAAASRLRQPAGRHRGAGVYRQGAQKTQAFGQRGLSAGQSAAQRGYAAGQQARQKAVGFANQHKKPLAIGGGAVAVGAGGGMYAGNRKR
jgi:hypothetical protein